MKEKKQKKTNYKNSRTYCGKHRKIQTKCFCGFAYKHFVDSLRLRYRFNSQLDGF